MSNNDSTNPEDYRDLLYNFKTRIENGEEIADLVDQITSEFDGYKNKFLHALVDSGIATAEDVIDTLRTSGELEEAGKGEDSDNPNLLIEPVKATLVEEGERLDFEPIPGALRNGAVSLWHGPGGVGKSLIALQFMVACVDRERATLLTGSPLPKPHDREHLILYFTLEDTLKDVRFRLSSMCGRYQSNDRNKIGQILLVPLLTGTPEQRLEAIRRHAEKV